MVSNNVVRSALKTIKNKRARIVIEHILSYGSISTEDLEKRYGYSHPPRAVRDVREAGIPVETFWVKSTGGKKIAAYRFGDLTGISSNILRRQNMPKKFREEVYSLFGGRCEICGCYLEGRYFQVDHRVPYEISKEKERLNKIKDYMLVCNSCNRAKSWSCEHCKNWKEKRVSTCRRCYWADPRSYEHIATKSVRRTDLIWQSLEEIAVYEKIKVTANRLNIAVGDCIKKMLKKVVS